MTTVPCHNLLWRQDLNMSDLNLLVEHIKFFLKKTNNDSIISLIYYWLFIGEKIIMIREVRGIFDICHNMQLTLAQLEMFVQSTVNILEHLPLNKWSKMIPGPDLLKYEQGYPANSPHDIFPPWWVFVHDDNGGNLSGDKIPLLMKIIINHLTQFNSSHWWWLLIICMSCYRPNWLLGQEN